MGSDTLAKSSMPAGFRPVVSGLLVGCAERLARAARLVALLALPSIAAAQNTTVTLTPAGNPPPAPPWTWSGGTANPLVLTGTSNIPQAVTGVAQVNITMTHSYIGDAQIRLEFTPSTGPGAGAPIGVDILNQFGTTISIGSVGYPSNLSGSYTFIDPPAGQSTLANGNTNYTAAPGAYRAYGKYSVPTTLSTSLTGVVGTGTWKLTFTNPGSGGGGGLGAPPSVSAASVTFTSGGCPGAWSALPPGAVGGFAMAALPGGDVMVGDAGRYNPATNAWTQLATRTNGNVNCLSVAPNGDVIVGGSFTTAGGAAASKVARYNPTTGAWSALGAGVSGGNVNAVVVLAGGDVIAGGDFTIAGGVAVNRVARYNAATNTWSAMGTGLIGSSSAVPIAYAMALLPSGLVVIAGDFYSGNGVGAGGFIRYNPATGAWLSTAGPGIATYTSALTVLPGGDVIAGGTAPVFPPSGGSYLLGRYNPTTNAWTGLGVYTSGIVGSLSTLPSGDVVVGGGFVTAGGVTVNGIGRCNPNTDSWTGLGSGVGFTGSFPPGTYALLALPGGDVLASGGWTSIGGVAASGIARYTFGSTTPSITGQPQPVSVCPTSPARFTVAASGASPTYLWQWQPEGSLQWIDAVEGVNTNPSTGDAAFHTTGNGGHAQETIEIIVETIPPKKLRCIVSNPCGSVTSDAAQLYVDPADLGKQGGVPGRDGLHDNNDFVVFIDLFFNQQPAADLGKQGGVIGSDGQFDNNDFVVFIDQYFAGC